MFTRPSLNIVDCISFNAKFRGDRVAFICGEHRINWREFNKYTNKIANSLVKSGLKKGEKVGLLCLNSIDAIAVLFGTMKAGGVIVPLSLLLTPQMIACLVKDAACRFFFTDSYLKPLADFSLLEVDSIPKEKRISIGFEEERYTLLQSFIDESSEDLPDVLLNDDDEACIIYSSGTTGAPKGIIHTHLSRTMFALSMTISAGGISASTVMIATTPLFANTFWGTIMPTMFAGGTTVMLTMFSPGGFLEAVHKERGKIAMMVPTQFQGVLNHPDLNKYDVSSLALLICAGATLPVPLKKQIIEKFGNILTEAYGITEGIATNILPEYILEKPTSVGIPVFGADVRIIDDEGKGLPAGEVGEIAGYSHWFMKGYHNNPQATAEMVWLDERGRTFMRTGDMGRLDDDGFLYIVDRKRDMIVSGGLNVFAVDIEGILQQHEEIKDVAVIAIPHDKWGETPLALVIRRPGAKSTEEEMKEWANAKLAKYQRIGRVEYREEDFPRNVLGKVLKRVLREPYWKDRS
ncbi:MAG: AMP-dependent synthetase [Deltaproteobacteria bacterium HGW-Deltaproteobacteria-19]|jgi:acyl-CoA synthetase (AMP-forming)/AMP-acid ligase II|nr:MAG: AMP-dependent synthetase [Deltaproteobacteria bacterium HGW-Deltaproteobacteria-19]